MIFASPCPNRNAKPQAPATANSAYGHHKHRACAGLEACLKPILSQMVKLRFSLMTQPPGRSCRHTRRLTSLAIGQLFSGINEKGQFLRHFCSMNSVGARTLRSRTARRFYPAPHCTEIIRGTLCRCPVFRSKIHVRVAGRSRPAAEAEIGHTRVMFEHHRRL